MLFRSAKGTIASSIFVVAVLLLAFAPTQTLGTEPTCGLEPVPASANRPGSAPLTAVNLKNGQLSVALQAACLGAVLETMAQHANFAVMVADEARRTPLTDQFQDLALKDGLTRLLKDTDYVFVLSHDVKDPAIEAVVVMSPTVGVRPPSDPLLAEPPTEPPLLTEHQDDPLAAVRLRMQEDSVTAEERVERLNLLLDALDSHRENLGNMHNPLWIS